MEEKLNIAIIDDDKIDRETIRRYLRKRGRDITFYEACNGNEAAEVLSRKDLSCIFLDYNMPDTDGISLLRRYYNAQEGLAPAPTVMFTGKGSESVMIDAIRWGVQDYLVKDNLSSDSLNIAMTKARELYELKKSQYQAMEILRQSQKMEAVGQLTSGIAHDFNNLLMIILGNTRMQSRLLIDNNLPEIFCTEFSKKITSIETSAQKGSDLVNRLMVFTRQRPLEVEVVNINDHIREIEELLSRTLGSRIQVKTSYQNDLWPVRIDAPQFENALINLAVNARDAMPEGGFLTIETKNVLVDDEYVYRHPDMSSGPYVMIAVSDNGVGMTSDVIQRIFEPFFTTKATGSGTGLGLSMVYGMLKQSGGYIHVYSELGHGSVFRIYIPQHVIGAEQYEQSQDVMFSGSETILIVDDDDRIRSVGAGMLERLGYRALQAKNGRTALEILKHEHQNVSLLFTDVIMSDGMHGKDLAEKVRQYFPQIKVLFTSGYPENAMPGVPFLEGQNFIGKPYQKQELAQKIRQILH